MPDTEWCYIRPLDLWLKGPKNYHMSWCMEFEMTVDMLVVTGQYLPVVFQTNPAVLTQTVLTLGTCRRRRTEGGGSTSAASHWSPENKSESGWNHTALCLVTPTAHKTMTEVFITWTQLFWRSYSALNKHFATLTFFPHDISENMNLEKCQLFILVPLVNVFLCMHMLMHVSIPAH